jgi:putative hemolysin
MDVLLIAVLTFLNGLFAMSELALASSRKPRLVAMAEDGDNGAAAALNLLEHPTRFLSTVQVGITATGILNGIVGEAAFSHALAQWLEGLSITPRISGIAATAIVVTIITFITIIFGELVPKRIGQLYPETVSRWVARPMAWLARVAGPFVKLLSATTQGVLKLLAIDTTRARGMTEEEIAHSLEEGVDAGVIEQHERQMVANVFHLDDRPLTSMMVPRSDIQWLDAGLSITQALRQIGQDGAHSWYPVCRGSLDNVLGVVSVAKLLAAGPDSTGTVEQHATPALFVHETLSGMELLE